MTKAELIESLKDWPDDADICIATPAIDGYKGWWYNDVAKVYGSKARNLPNDTVFLKNTEVYLEPTNGRISP